MTVKSELLELSARNRKLTTGAVIEWAKRHPSSAIYSALEWDDRIAGQKYRKWQVMQLIAMNVFDDAGDRQLISLSIDRDVGGYRHVDDVLKAPDLAAIMLDDAQAELLRVRSKYGRVKALTEVWFTIDRATGKLKKKAKVPV